MTKKRHMVDLQMGRNNLAAPVTTTFVVSAGARLVLKNQLGKRKSIKVLLN
jgi:hypothetical protein